MYKVLLTNRAINDLNNLNNDSKERIIKKIERI